MISDKIGQGAQVPLKPIVKVITLLRVKPNHLTFLGFVMSICTAYAFARGQFQMAGAVLIIAGLFDMADGMVARTLNATTPFGAFLRFYHGSLF